MNRIFVLIFICLIWSDRGQAQSIDLVLEFQDQIDTLIVSSSKIDSVIETRLRGLSQAGFWDAHAELITGENGSDELEVKIIPGEPSQLAFIHFQGLKKGDSSYLEKEFKMGKPGIASVNLDQAKHRVARLGYVLVEGSGLSQDEEGFYHMNYKVKSQPELMAQGLASFNQKSGADTLSWYGQVNVHIPNIGGKGLSFDFAWDRLTSNSESFNLGFQYPWILQLPLSGLFKFGREVIDGNYQIIQTSGGLEWDIDWEQSIYFSYEKTESIITNEGSLQYPEWQASKKRLLGLGYRQAALIRQTHSGVSLNTSLFQEMNFEPSSMRKLTLRSEAQLPLPAHFFISQRSVAHIQNSRDAASDPSILVPLGGVNSVRGFEEAHLRVPNLLTMQTSLHYSIGKQSQVLAFYDIGLHNKNNSIVALDGYGLGVQLRSGRGPIRLILATHKGLNLRNSFLHIEYSGGIEWIDR